MKSPGQGKFNIEGLPMNKPVLEAQLQSAIATQTPPRRPNRRTLVMAASAAAAVLIVSYSFYWWNVGRWMQTTDDAYVGGNTAPLATQVSGFVTEILFDDNQFVRRGQPLIRIDPRLYRAAVERAAANLEQQKATLENLHARYTLQQSSIAQAEADLAGKTAAATFASLDAKRYQALAQSSSGSEQNAQKATAANDQAKASVDGATATLAAAKQQLTVIRTQIAQAEAAVEAAKADLATAQLNLGYTEIRSPVDGFVGNRAAQVGAYVANGAYLVSVIPSKDLWVDANFKEDQLGRMRSGQRARVVADVASNKVIEGTITSLAPATGAVFSVIPPENATGNFTKIVQRVPVRIKLDDKNGILRPGLSTTVTVDTRPE
jgi:membrane fusion protein, multidrug efflux system